MKMVFLGDIVERKKSIVDKDSTELLYYVGGEHIESGRIRVKNKGIIKGSTIGPAFHMRFDPGDVLLMSRNPHLKKAGIVDFEGVCSDVTYVCRTKDENQLLQSFIPFLFQSNSFWTFAEENKKGSTNFFLNWSDFEKFRFNLPDINTQRELSETLWSIENTIDAYKDLIISTKELAKALFIEMFGLFPDNPKHWKTGSIRDVVLDVRYGSSRPAVEGGRYPYLRMNNITYDGELDLSDTKRIDIPDSELEKSSVRRGDLLFNRTNSKELVGKTCVYNRDEQMILAGFVIRVRLNNSLMMPEFLSAFLNTDFSKAMLLGLCKAAIGQANINAQEMQNIGIYIPPIDEQKRFVSIKERIDNSRLETEKAIENLNKLKNEIIKQYLDEGQN